MFFFQIIIVSFAVQNPLNLHRSHLFIFVSVSIILGDGLKKIVLQFVSERVLSMFSSRSFIMLVSHQINPKGNQP